MFIQRTSSIIDRARPLPPTDLPLETRFFLDAPELVGSRIKYGRDEEIYGETEDAEFIYKVVSGAVRTCKLLGDGRRQIGAFHLPGDVFGLESGATHHLTAEAVVDTVVVIVKRGAVEAAATRNPVLARQLWMLTARCLDHAEEHMLLLGRKTAAERVAAFLLEMEARTQLPDAIHLPMCRRDIADYLGLTLETVSRSLSQLQDQGVVALSGARDIRVRRRSRLELAGEQAD